MTSRTANLMYSAAALASIGVTGYGLRSFYLAQRDPLQADHLIKAAMAFLENHLEVLLTGAFEIFFFDRLGGCWELRMGRALKQRWASTGSPHRMDVAIAVP